MAEGGFWEALADCLSVVGDSIHASNLEAKILDLIPNTRDKEMARHYIRDLGEAISKSVKVTESYK